MRIYWVTVKLINHFESFAGPVTARSARAAEDLVLTDIGSRNVDRIQVEAV